MSLRGIVRITYQFAGVVLAMDPGCRGKGFVMKKDKLIFRGFYTMALVAIGGSAVGMGALMSEVNGNETGQEDEVVSLSQVPGAVRKTIMEHAMGGKIEQIEKSDEDGEVVYDVEVEKGGHDFEFEVANDGTFLGTDHEDEDEHADEDDDGDSDEADDEADDGEQVFEIAFGDAPRSVRDSFEDHTDDAKPTLVERIIDEEVTKYEIEYAHKGHTASMTFTDHGEIMEMESAVEIHRLPKAIRDEIMKDYPGATIEAAEAVQLFYYEMDVMVDGKVIEVGAFASGDIEDRLVPQQEDEEGNAHGGNDDDDDELDDDEGDQHEHGDHDENEEDDDD